MTTYTQRQNLRVTTHTQAEEPTCDHIDTQAESTCDCTWRIAVHCFPLCLGAQETSCAPLTGDTTPNPRGVAQGPSLKMLLFTNNRRCLGHQPEDTASSACSHMSHSSLELCCSYPIKEQTWALSCHRRPPCETKSQHAQRQTWAPSQYSTDAQHPNSQTPHPTALPFSAGSQLEPSNWKHAPPSQVIGSQMPCLEWLVPQTHSNRLPTPPPRRHHHHLTAVTASALLFVKNLCI